MGTISHIGYCDAYTHQKVHGFKFSRLLALFFCLFALCVSGLKANAQLSAEMCETANVSQTTIRTVNQLGELELNDGRTLNLAGLYFKKSESLREAIISQIKDVVALQSLVRVYTWQKEPDRWGRTLGDVVFPLGDSAASLHAVMLDGGHAFVQPHTALSTLCIHQLKAFEAQARNAKRGIWAQNNWPLQASQDFKSDDVAILDGTVAMMEGRVRSIGVRKNATYLNFGAFGSQALTVVIAPKIWLALEEQGLNRKRLKSAQVQIRGVLEKKRTLTMRIHLVEDIDVKDVMLAPNIVRD